MVERSLSMREVPGSMPGFSNFFLIIFGCKLDLLSSLKIYFAFFVSV
jgi:hypothetical protein